MNTTEYQDKLASLIKGIAKKVSYKLYSRDPEDIEQDLWVKVLSTMKKKGVDQLDLNLVARICYDYVKDMIDYDQRRNHISVDLSGTEDTDETSSEVINSLTDKGNHDSDIMIQDLYNQFPEGSKERIFLDFWGNESGAMPNTNVLPPSTRSNDGFSENALAQMLGYASASSGGYRKFRDRMKTIISNYFNTEV